MAGPKNSPARIRANNRYNERAYDRINVALPKGEKAAVLACAAARGESLNRFVTRAIRELVERTGEEARPAPKER